MGRFFDCQMALVSWGAKAKFRRAKVGLLRKGNSLVYIAIFSHSKDNYKFQIEPGSVEILPAAIRLLEQQKDLFIRQVSDEQRYTTMVREIKVLLRKDKLRQTGKGDALDRLISSIPSFSAISPLELVPSRVSARLVGVDVVGQLVRLDGNYDDSKRSSVAVHDLVDGNDNENYDVRMAADDEGRFFEANRMAAAIDNLGDRLTGGGADGGSVGGGVGLTRDQRQRLINKQLKCIKICGLDRLPEQLWFKNSLHELTLTDCNLTFVPKQLELFATSLTHLDLSRNRIDKLPRTFCCKMNSLKFLDLSYNLIEFLPIEIKFFRRLIDLNLSHNHLRMLPSTFSDLRRLELLNVANNNLSQLPAFRREDIRLRELDVSYNPLDGALNEASTFEVYPALDDGSLDYYENSHPTSSSSPSSLSARNKSPSLFEIALLNVVRDDDLLKLASEESLPRTIVSTMQRDIFKCYKCNRMNILPAYNSTDILDYVEQVGTLHTSGNFRHGMTFMKLMCRVCFDKMIAR